MKTQLGLQVIKCVLGRRPFASTAFQSRQPVMQVYVQLLETVGGLLALALAPHCTFLPQPYVDALLHSPVIGQDDAATQMQLPAVSDLWSGTGHGWAIRPFTV
jgi:hypothetical protein